MKNQPEISPEQKLPKRKKFDTHMEEQKKRIERLTRDEADKESLMTRWARAWATQSVTSLFFEWLAICIPTLLLIAIAPWAFVVAAVAITLIFTAVTLVLKNHYDLIQSSQNTREGKINLIVEAWDNLINMLGLAAENLQEEVDRFSDNQDCIEENIEKQKEVNFVMEMEIKQLSSTVNEVNEEAELLSETTSQLHETTEKYALFVKESEEKNREMEKEHAVKMTLFSAQIARLEKEVDMQKLQNEHTKTVNQSLKEVLQNLITIRNNSAAQSAEFHEQTKQIISNAETRSQAVLDKMNQEHQRYQREIDRLMELNEEMAESLERDKQMSQAVIDRMAESKLQAPCRTWAGFHQPRFLENEGTNLSLPLMAS